MCFEILPQLAFQYWDFLSEGVFCSGRQIEPYFDRLRFRKAKLFNVVGFYKTRFYRTMYIVGRGLSEILEPYFYCPRITLSSALASRVQHKNISPQLVFGTFASNAIGLNSGIGGSNGEYKSTDQQKYAKTANVELPFGEAGDFLGRIRHGFLRYKIGIFALLGSLTVGAAGWLGISLVLDGRRLWQRIVGWCLFPLGVFSAVFFWGWGLSGYPLAFIDRGGRFFNILLG